MNFYVEDILTAGYSESVWCSCCILERDWYKTHSVLRVRNPGVVTLFLSVTSLPGLFEKIKWRGGGGLCTISRALGEKHGIKMN